MKTRIPQLEKHSNGIYYVRFESAAIAKALQTLTPWIAFGFSA